jgi:branched-chain amino acid transport system substrate-binding protein
MRKLVILTLAAVIVAAVLAGGCAKPAPSSAPTPAPAQVPSKILDIGIATPLTGPAAHQGVMMQNGVLLAIEDQNKQGGVTIAGQKYTLNAIIRDTKFDLIVAKSVAEELIFEKGVKVIAGPFIADAIGVQAVTEPNKVIMFGAVIFMPSLTGPNKPYSFFCAWPIEQMYISTFSYMQKFYPEVKTFISLAPEAADVPLFTVAAESMSPKYGLEWLGIEKFPYDAKDLMPVISRALTKNPDAIDTCTTGSGGPALCALLIKQAREAGFKGPILIPLNTEREVVEEVVPQKYLTGVVINRTEADSPVSSEAFRSYCARYQNKYDMVGGLMDALLYNPVKGFFEFLNSQDSMDTTVWMEGFAKYHWQGLFGFESYWVGKPLRGIDRQVFGPSWVGEWTDGNLVIKWTAPLPYDIFVEK